MATLSELVSQTTEIKNKISTCHGNLKTKLNNKGVGTSTSDTLTSLINKIDQIPNPPEGYDKIPPWLQTKSYYDSWLTGESCINAVNCAASAVVGNKIYIIGGCSTTTYPFKSNYCYDTTTNEWTYKNNINLYVAGASAATYQDRYIYVIGGWGNNHALHFNNVCFDTVTNTWSSKSSNIDVVAWSSSAVIGDNIHCIGFCNGDFTSSERTHIVYNIKSDLWSYDTSLPSSMGQMATAVHDNKIYCIGGANGASGQIFNTNRCYDPVTKTWTNKANMNTATKGALAANVCGKIYVIGGYNQSGYSKDTQCYNIATNTWETNKTPMFTIRRYLAGGAVNDNIYCIGGENLSESYNVNEIYIPRR